jgi:hypothetical protein
MMEPIVADGVTLAYVLRNSKLPEKTMFPTSPDLELQVGFVVYPAGGVIPAHRHVPVPRTVTKGCEVILVRKGRCELDLYKRDGKLVATRELKTDDLVILLEGGHGFRMQEDTVLLEVKQGPYIGVKEKESLP